MTSSNKMIIFVKNYDMKYIGYNLPSTLMIFLAGCMIVGGVSNWGWLIFAAMLASKSPCDEINNKNE